MNRTLDPLTRFNDPQGTYAFCPVCLPDAGDSHKTADMK